MIIMIEELGESGLRILLFLGKKKEANISTLKKELYMGSAGVYSALSYLFKYGLVKKERRGKERVISITEKGAKVVEKLLEADQLIKEDT